MEQPLPQPVQIETPPSPRPEVKAPEGIEGKVKEWTEKGKEWLTKLWRKSEEAPREVLEEVKAAPKMEEELIHDAETQSTESEKTGGPASLEEVIRRAKELGVGTITGKGLSLAEKKALYGEEYLEVEKRLYGQKIAAGATSKILIDRENQFITKLFEPNLTDEQINANTKQVAMYREHQKEHPFLAYVREIPGGWQQEHFPNDGNLRDFISSGGKITQEMVEQAVENYIQLVQITGSAHGDLIKRPEFLGDWQREILRKQLEAAEYTGYINHEQILVGKPDKNGARRFIFIDWGGGGDPFPIKGTQDPNDERFKQGELEGLKTGLQTILDRQQTNPITTGTSP